jgi:6-phosphogluconolactonase
VQDYTSLVGGVIIKKLHFLIFLSLIVFSCIAIFLYGCSTNPTGGGGGGAAAVYTLTLSVSTEYPTSETFGKITVVPSTDSYQYSNNATVEMTAVPLGAYMFSSWEGSISGETSPKWITMDGNKSVLARFKITPPDKYLLNITISPDPSDGSVHESGTSPYDAGTTVTLTADANLNYIFDHWGGELSGSTNPTTITMNTTKDVTASFKHLYHITAESTPTSYGTVWPTSEVLIDGASVTLIATAEPGYRFVSWEGDITGTQNPKTITLDADKTIYARFRSLYNYNLNTTVTPDGSGTIEPWNGIFTEDSTAVVTASANSCYAFDHWSGDLSGSVNPTTITMNATKDVTAYFSHSFLYIANSNANNVSGYWINSDTGTLEEVSGSPFTTGTQPFGVAADPTGKYLYVPNISSNNISAYSINPSTGFLTSITGSPFTAEVNPAGIAADPSGKYLYVANMGSANLSAYSIDASTGSLTSITGSPFSTGASPYGTTIDPSGKYLYVVNYGNNNISAYEINSGTGALTTIEGSPFTAGAFPSCVAAEPSGKYLYATNYGISYSNNISAYRINLGTGALTTIEGSPFTGRGNPMGVTADPSGKYLYVANYDNTVSAYSINLSTGALTSISYYSSGVNSIGIVADPSGKYLYVANSASASISGYNINSSTGALTSTSPPTFSAGLGSIYLTIVKIVQ